MEKQRLIPGFISDILAQCRTNPSRIAIIDRDGRKCTYGDFLNIIERTCGFIESKGFPSGSFLVISLPNCMEYLAIEYGAWLSGCAVAPVSPLYPKERIDYISDHCEAKVVIDETVLREIEQSPRLEICEPFADIAALFYTSGSTGNPKGVIHTFDTLGHMDHFNDIVEFIPDDVFGLGSPFSFIACLFTIPVFRTGACVRLIDRSVMTDVRKLQACFDKEGITGAFVGPSTLRQLSFKDNRNIRFILTGSERVSNFEPQGNYKLINIYGMTETAAITCHFDITKPYSNTPIGKPLSDYEVKLMEDGEICVRGPLSPGYYKDPERSAELWRGGWMHTGDLGRILPDGNLEYLNRKDWMVKINGQRVETGEIIQVIKEVEGVINATAKGFTAPDGHQYIVAYYVAEDSVSEDSIIGYISRKLAPYMIPSNFVRMSALPLNFNGKIDVKSLQSPLEMNSERSITPPENEIQKALCAAFEKSLGISPVGIDDDFFSLGGDSIRVMQLQLACPQFNLSSSIIYQARNVRRISEALDGMRADENAPRNEIERYPLSQTQRGIFAECMSRRGEAVYNNPFLYRVADGLDAEKLADAVSKAVSAHPNLFASISVDENGEPFQSKTSPEDLSIKVEEVSEQEFLSIRLNLVQPFDILSDRLFRIRVFKTGQTVRLFVDFHHIVFDGSSNSIILDDIEKAYSGQSVENESYSGFDLAYDEELDRKTTFFEECKKWNTDTFAEVDQISLPDPDKFIDSVSFSKIETETGISSHAFSKAAERLGVTENVLATGAFGYMLGACTHASSSAFATIYNGRKSLKTSRTVSMMVKTLPVSCRWNSETRIEDYFLGVKNQIVGAMAHDLFSFAEICASTAYDSRVIFSYQDELLGRKTLCGRNCELVSLLENATGEPFTVQLYKDNGSLSIRTEYRNNMYSEDYVKALVSCFQSVLSSLILADKNQLTSTINLVSHPESLINIGSGARLDFDRSETFVTLFKRQVKNNPDSTAVVDEQGCMSYAELDRASDSLASLLASGGVGQEEFVALMLPRLRCFPVSYIACFKCGAAYVPMDFEYPHDRIQYMIEDSRAKVLLTTRAIYEAKCAEGNLEVEKVIFVDEVQSSSSEPIDRSKSDGLAYMIYTSGTTGKPKGVMIEHHSIVNLVHWYSAMENIGPGCRIAQHASFSFDGSIPDLMVPLCTGAELHIIPAGLRKDLSGLYRYFCENRIDGVILTTQLGLTMLKMYDLKLRFMMLGGEKMSGPFKTKVHLYNGYGPTEFTVCSSCHLVDNDNVPDNIPIGKAVPNTISAVVDSLGRLLPRGVAGELVLIGEQLSRGYWNRPETTAERFTPCPFIPGETMYHTGDLVKWNEDGELLYMGRIDTQVKLRGFRIELGEIESTVLKYEGVKSAVVAVKEISGLQHLIAYYCSEKEIDNDCLRNFLSESLTDYMVPTAYVRMAALPMTPNGKVDVRNLPIPEIKAEEIVEAETDIEKQLFGLTSEFLKNDAFGVTTNLISMGMTSLGAISLSLQIERKLGSQIPSSRMLECPTIRQWAEFLDVPNSENPEIPVYDKRDFYPMTDNQTGIYIDWEQHKDSTQYNVPMLFKFEGVSPEAVVEAARAFVNAHGYLKTRLTSENGTLMQQRRDALDFEVPVTNLESEPDRSYFQQRLRPFDLFEGPLFRFEVFTFEGTVWLLSDIHHIVFDGGSEALLVKEIVDSLNGKPSQSETFSAFDFSLYYQDWKASGDFDKAEKYFSSLLSGVSPASLSSDPESGASGSSTLSVAVDRKSLSRLCRKCGVTENALFLTAVTETLHRFTREDDIAILTVSGGRSLPSLEKTCGMFVQTLPVVSHHSVKTVGEALIAMHNQVIDTLSRDKYPYTRIVEKTGLRAGILVAYQGGVLEGGLTVGGKPVVMDGLALDTAKMPLSINIVPSSDSTILNFEFDNAAFGEKDILPFANAVRDFVDNISSVGPETSLADISCVSLSTTSGLVELGSGPYLEVSGNETIVGLVHKTASEHPDSIALVGEDGRLSYSELDRASDSLGALLVERGVKAEDFVALMLPRTTAFPVAFMAVYKSGGAYVPMDYEYPVDRIQYMIEDSKAKVLVTTRTIFEQKMAEGELKAGNVIFVDEIDYLSREVPYLDCSKPSGLAYMIYTSGTTGKPKGVMIEHHSLMNTMAWQSRFEKLSLGTRVAEHASFSFDASVINLMTTLGFGGELHILDEKCRKDPELINKYFIDNKIEVTTMSTQLGMMLLSSYKLPIRHINMGGEKLTGKYGGGITVANQYGPTEFTVCSCYHVVDPVNEADNIPIGRPVPNSVSAIVDSCGQLLPEGVAGELVLIGTQIARGYWNKDEITKKRFVDCPFIPGEKMYRTGDLVRWNEAGELLFLGRIDTQVKLRGFRIELGEIESVMAKFEGVTAAVAQVKEIGGVQHLCGYFTASCAIDEDALKAHLSSCLTAYMVPDALMQLDALPLTPNGKVDLKKLPVPNLASKAAAAFEAPEGELEQDIADAFVKALGTSSQFGRNDSFFQSGGTSLLVMKVIVMLSEKGYKLTYGDVFKYQTPRALAAFIEGYQAGLENAAPSPVTVVSTEEEGVPVVGEDGYDYSAINNVLSSNAIDSIGSIGQLDVNEIGDVLLLGSTGYLGIHILEKLLTEHEGRVWCVIRPKKGISCAGRLRSYLMYYFDNTFAELFDKRLFVIEGDMTDEDIMPKLLGIHVDTVINCAANVKHFAAGDEIEKINLNGAEKLIDFCMKTGSRLIHTSTHSISGQMENAAPHFMKESDLYFGQRLMTKYQTSKFAAERAILEACGKGLKAKIMRLGNLMPRFSDGEFQINVENNGFMARMRAYYLIGCIAASHLHSSLEFAPIDETAAAILCLARTPDKFTVFHPFNNHTIYVDDVVSIMRKCGLGIAVTDEAVFNEKLQECLKNDRLNPFITTLLAYGSHSSYVVNPPSQDFTIHVLNAMDWRWPITGSRYLSDAFAKMISLDYFNK